MLESGIMVLLPAPRQFLRAPPQFS